MFEGYTKLAAMLTRHEGLSLTPYTDTTGNLTIGVGRNLTARGITAAEANVLLVNDIQLAMKTARTYSWFSGLNEARQDVIVSMIFNMGGKFNLFSNMLACLVNRDYSGAADEMLDSLWARQVKQRAVELAQMMKDGAYTGA